MWTSLPAIACSTSLKRSRRNWVIVTSMGGVYTSGQVEVYTMVMGRLEGGDDRFAEGLGAGVTADVAGEGPAFGVDLLECGLDLLGSRGFVDVVEHEDGGLKEGSGIGLVLA